MADGRRWARQRFRRGARDLLLRFLLSGAHLSRTLTGSHFPKPKLFPFPSRSPIAWIFHGIKRGPILDSSLALILSGHVGSGLGSLSLSLSLLLCFISCGPMAPIRVGVRILCEYECGIHKVHAFAFMACHPSQRDVTRNLIGY